MRTIMAIVTTLALAACASSAGYGRSAGVATYDDLKAAQQAWPETVKFLKEHTK